MKIVYGFDAVRKAYDSGSAFPLWKNVVMAMGNFDGVHLGHQQILEETVKTAEAISGTSICLTFSPHPAKILVPQHAPKLIQTEFQKFSAIALAGIQVLLVQKFDQDFAQIEYREFFEEYVEKLLKPKAIRVGCRFAFGHNRKGNAENMAALCAAKGVDFSALAEFRLGAESISSGRIRSLLTQGRLSLASDLLGRPYEIYGLVEKGEGRGADLGYPTANVAFENEMLLPKGVYACRVRATIKADDARELPLKSTVAPTWWSGVANLGVRPTFKKKGKNVDEEEPLVLEIHIFERTENLYGKYLHLEVVEYLRPEKRFESVKALQTQIAEDCRKAKALLG